MRIRPILCGFLFSVVLFFTAAAHAITITGAFTGAWFDENDPGQGFLIQIVEVEGELTAVVYWFTFDADGNQVWLVGSAPVDGDQVTLTMLLFEGGVLSLGDFDPSQVTFSEWGQLILVFEDCDSGMAMYEALDPAIGSGEFDLSRLTETVGDECTGGISDNNSPNSAATNLFVTFENTGEDADASGKVKFEENANWTKFKVWIRKLPTGDYDLVVGGETVGVITTNNGGNGDLFFRSPEGCGWPLLDFDPRGQTIEIVQDDVVFLTVMLGDEVAGDDDDDDGTGKGTGDDDDDDDDEDDDEDCDAEE